MNNDINREISIENVEYNIDITNQEYTIELNPTESYVLELNEQGPQGLRGDTGNGIESYVKTSSSGLTDTYTITFTDGNTTTVDVTNGKSIVSIEKTSTLGLVDTYTISYNDNSTSTFTVTNGIDGVNPTITVGTTTTGNPGTNASVVNSGTTQDVVLDFTIPRGDKGETGENGADGFSPIATVSKVSDTATISITDINGTTTATISDGINGTDGQAATITVGTVTTGLPTDPASVTNVGTSSDAIFDFTIPKGNTGDTGATGNGIASITKTGTVGLVDTYTILYTDGTSTTFTVTNGQNGSGSVADVLVNGTSVLDGQDAKILIKTINSNSITGSGNLNVGTVTSVNNTQPDASGNVTLTIPDTSNLANKDLSNLSSTGNVKFQAPLVSGTNIKTLNGNSILGSGDLTLDGLPSQTGQSGKFLTTDGTDASWGSIPIATASTVGVVKPDNSSIRVSNDGTLSAICRNVGEIISSTLPLTDAGLHLLDGSLLQYGIYKEFIDYIAELYAENPSANYFTTEVLWQQSVTTYGSCGKFVYDSTNNTVRLPKVSDILQGITDLTALGDLVASGLPQHTHTRGSMNITGSLWRLAMTTTDLGKSGAFSGSYVDGTKNQGGSGTWQSAGIEFNAANAWTGNTSNANYTSTIATTSKVQPQTIKVLYYIVIANSTKTDIQVDIDEIATDLNNKVGKNGDSVNGTYYDENDGLALVITNTNITDCDGTPTANTYSGIQFNDANGVRYGKLEGSWVTGGYTSFGFNTLRRVNGSNVYAQVRSWVDANGNTYFDFPKCTTKPTQTSSATNNKVAVVTQNYKNGNSWYRVYSDGWCEQGGTTTISSDTWVTITLLKAYKSTDYCVSGGSKALDSSYANTPLSPSFRNYTTTNFNASLHDDTTVNKGTLTWRACGYIN